MKGNYSILESASLIVLCGGTGWNELPKTVAAQKLLNGVNYTLAINMSTDTECERYSEKLQINLNDYVIMPYSPAPFNAKDCDAVFDKLYSAYQIAEPKENEDEYEA